MPARRSRAQAEAGPPPLLQRLYGEGNVVCLRELLLSLSGLSREAAALPAALVQPHDHEDYAQVGWGCCCCCCSRHPQCTAACLGWMPGWLGAFCTLCVHRHRPFTAAVPRPLSAPPARPCWSAPGACCAPGRRRCATASPSPKPPASARCGLLASLAAQHTCGWRMKLHANRWVSELPSPLLLLLGFPPPPCAAGDPGGGSPAALGAAEVGGRRRRQRSLLRLPQQAALRCWLLPLAPGILPQLAPAAACCHLLVNLPACLPACCSHPLLSQPAFPACPPQLAGAACQAWPQPSHSSTTAPPTACAAPPGRWAGGGKGRGWQQPLIMLP